MGWWELQTGSGEQPRDLLGYPVRNAWGGRGQEQKLWLRGGWTQDVFGSLNLEFTGQTAGWPWRNGKPWGEQCVYLCVCVCTSMCAFSCAFASWESKSWLHYLNPFWRNKILLGREHGHLVASVNFYRSFIGCAYSNKLRIFLMLLM